jgi:hypothetical protein
MSGKRGSRYARLAGTAWRHRVTGTLSPCAWSLWTRCMSYCPDEETDGVIPRAMLRAIAGGATTDRELKAGLTECLKAGVLREREDRDYEVAGYTDHNITRDEDERRRELAARRQVESRSTKAHVTRDVTRDKSSDKSVSHTESHASVTALSLTQDSGLRTQDSDPIGEVVPRPVARPPVSGATPARPPKPRSRPSPLEPLEAARRLVIAGYGARFEHATREPWMGASAAGQALDTVAAWCVAAARGGALEPIVDRLLDGAFAASNLRDHRWPLRWVAEDPGRYATAPSAPGRFDHVPADHVPQLASYADEVSDGPI